MSIHREVRDPRGGRRPRRRPAHAGDPRPARRGRRPRRGPRPARRRRRLRTVRGGCGQESAALEQARLAAVRDAVRRARSYAAAVGSELTALLEIRDSGTSRRRLPSRGGRMAAVGTFGGSELQPRAHARPSGGARLRGGPVHHVSTRPGGLPRMRYREGGDLDTSSVQDRRGGGGFGRGGGGRGLAVGGGGLGLVGLVVVVAAPGAGRRGRWRRRLPPSAGSPASARASRPTTAQLEQACDDGGDANTSVDCAVAADIDSIQDLLDAGARRPVRPDRHRLLRGPGADRLRRRLQRIRALLLPRRLAGLHRPELLRPAPVAVRRRRAGCS